MTAYIKSKSFRKSGPSRGTAILSLLVIISFCVMGLLYIIQTNGVISQAYQIRHQKDYLKKLQTENQALQLEAARLQSPSNLEKMAGELGMIEVGKVVYLEEERAVALRDK
jgi:cell division protein FtsB